MLRVFSRLLESLFHLCIYLLLVLRCPVDVIKYLEKIQRTAYGIIWWRSTTNVCCCDIVCKLVRGGLGILSFKDVNSTLLSKWLWRLGWVWTLWRMCSIENNNYPWIWCWYNCLVVPEVTSWVSLVVAVTKCVMGDIRF